MDYLQLIFAEVGTSLTILHDPITIRCPFGTNNIWRPVQAEIGVVKICKDSRTVCLYCSLDGDKIAEFVGYLHVRRLLTCSSATCISVGYSTYMCQFSFNIKAPLFVCSSLALNLLTTRLVLLLPVDLASFPHSFSRPFRL